MSARRGDREDRGAAAVETALCICFIVLPLLFGVISFGFMLSFRQTLSQAATEGARAAAVAVAGTPDATRTAAAKTAVENAVGQMADNHKCGDGVLTCAVNIAPCASSTTGQCATVTLSYKYRDNPMSPSAPGLGIILPETMSYSAVAEVS